MTIQLEQKCSAIVMVVEIISNLVIVSEKVVEAKALLIDGGYSEEDALKTIQATGFETLSRFDAFDVEYLISGTRDRMKEHLLDASVKLVVVVTQTNQRKIPNAASILQAQLDLNEDAFCVEIVDGCNGFVKALVLADRLLGEDQVGLIFAGEFNSLMLSGAAAGTSALFGDGFALTQVKKSGKFDSRVRQRGGSGDVIRFGGSDHVLHMDGFEVFAFTTRQVPDLLKGINSPAFDEKRFPVFHQASKLVVEQVAKRIGFENKQRPVFSAGTIGNLGAGSIPSWLAQQDDILDGSEIISVGFGSGLSWGYATALWSAERNELVYI